MSSSAWPAHLDALVAAPSHHRLLLENEHVRVLDTRIEPGDNTPVHTHQWPATHYVLGTSDFVRRDDAGAIMVDSRAAGIHLPVGAVFWGEPLPPHTLENVGAAPIHIISVEVKRRA